MQIFLYILLFTYFFAFIITLVATFFSALVYLRKPPARTSDFFEKHPLTIIKPIINLEINLRENLTTFFSQNYSKFTLSFCLEKKDIEIIQLIEQVAKSYPHISYKIYTEPAVVGQNPKINNIYKAINEAETQWILISDSNANAEKNYLQKMASYIEYNVASISSTIMGILPKTFASHIETVFLNIFYSRWAGVLAYFGKTAVVGKGLLLNIECLKNIGGLETISHYLAEDFMLGKFFQEKGYKTILAAHGVSEIVGHQDFKTVYKRHLRWGLIRKTSGLVGFIFEPVTYPLIMSLMGAFSFSFLFSVNPLIFFLINLCLCLFLDLLQYRNFSKKSYWMTLPAWFVKEAISVVLWVDILKSNSIHWRNKKFYLGKDSKLVFD